MIQFRRQTMRSYSTGLFAIFFLLMAGCLSSVFRGNDKQADVEMDDDDDQKPLQLVKDVGRPFGLEQYVATGVGLVTGLDNTGSNPAPSPERDRLLAEMRTRQVAHPAQVLASPETSLVTIRGIIPSGAREGDRFDVEVFVPRRSETTSLRGGWLMLAPVRPMAFLEGELHTGSDLGYTEGSIIDQGALEGSEDVALQRRGWVLGGGKVNTTRTMGLLLAKEEHWFRLVKQVEDAVNLRFHTYDRGQKVGAAEARRDTFIELKLPQRYRRNLTRFMKVVLHIPFNFETISPMDYVRQTGQELLDPETAEVASVRLEAIGNDAVPMLLEGVQREEGMVRFCASEALAYLNRGDGIKVLAEVAEQDAALRLRSITALAALDDLDAHDALTALLDSESAETRYGAFRALRELNPQDPALGRYPRAPNFHFYRVATRKSPLVHISRSQRPEIVLFGSGQQFASTPFVLFAGKHLVLKCDIPGHLVVKRFNKDGTEETRDCGGSVAEVMEALTEINASYPQAVHILQEAKRQGVLSSRLVFDALPRQGRQVEPGELDLPDEVDTPEDPQKP